MADWVEERWGSLAVLGGLSCFVLYKVSPLNARLFKSYRSLSERDQKDFDSRLPSTYHAVIITALAAYAILVSGLFNEAALPGVPLLARTSPLTVVALAFSLGYFVIDLGMMLRYYPWMGGAEMVVHHVAALLSVSRALVKMQAHMYTLAMLSTEITTPCINARWLLDKCGQRGHPLYFANGIAMMLLWLTNRILMFVPFIAHMWRHRLELDALAPHDYATIVAVPPLLLGLNVFWFAKIVRGALKLLGRPTAAAGGGSKAPKAAPVDNGGGAKQVGNGTLKQRAGRMLLQHQSSSEARLTHA